jgi:hypothetical protein
MPIDSTSQSPARLTQVRLESVAPERTGSDPAGDQPPIQAARMTLPRQPDFLNSVTSSTNEASGEPPNRLSESLNESAQRQKQASDAGVNVAKRSFFWRFGGALAVGLIAAGLVITGVATGGASLLVAGAMAGATGLRLGADTVCSGMLWRNEVARSRNEPPPYKLPMGADSVANLAYKLCPNSWSTDTRSQIGRWTSMLTDMTLHAANGLLTGGLSAWPMVSVGVGLVGANHGVQALLRRQERAEDLLADPAALNDIAPERVDAFEGALSNQAVGEQRLERLVRDLAALNLQAAQMTDGPERETLFERLEVLEQGINREVAGLERALEKVTAAAPSGKTVLGAGLMTVGFGALDFGAKKGAEVGLGLPGLGFTSSAIGLSLASRDLVQARKEVGHLHTLLGEHRQQLDQLTLAQRELRADQDAKDDITFDLVFEPLERVQPRQVWDQSLIAV